MTSLMDLAAAAIGLIHAFLEVGIAILMAHGPAARRLGENGRPLAHEEEHVAQGDASPLERFAGWTPHRRGRRYGRRPS